ncbi:MAG: 30S ribosomal protein S12 methylthiotransferase RimO [Muribaculaceae bacterium]|nr:30S ribosomal protein S12 methylthiotransferase RimO [Muribaculaceae bacterium]
MSFRKNHIDIITMGCSKNLIDSERIFRRLIAKGYSVSHDPEEVAGEYVVVNTCGFISDAKQESIDMILNLGSLKEEGKIRQVIAMGCLTERYRKTLQQELPEIDLLYGKFDWDGFISGLPDVTEKPESPKAWERKLTTLPHHAYMKISEGCNRFCAFCAIPLITGRHRSRPIEEILEETRELVASGVKEFNVIAQDLSSYGLDLYGRHALSELIDRMADIEGVEWIRLHYAYPADFPLDVLDVMARRPNVCKYLDIALQHISDSQLTAMRRKITKKETLELLDEIRRRVPGIKIRTTLMVGFPGETDEDFAELLEFVRTQKFARVGAFAYSEEDDTYAAMHLEDNVPQEVKEERLERLLNLTEGMETEMNRQMIGSQLTLMVDEVNEDGTRTCRSEYDSPDVDHIYTLYDSDALPGDMVRAEVSDIYALDLEAVEIED